MSVNGWSDSTATNASLWISVVGVTSRYLRCSADAYFFNENTEYLLL